MMTRDCLISSIRIRYLKGGGKTRTFTGKETRCAQRLLARKINTRSIRLRSDRDPNSRGPTPTPKIIEIIIADCKNKTTPS